MSPVELQKRLLSLEPERLERLMHVIVKHHLERDLEAAAFFETDILLAGLRQAAADAGLGTGAIDEPIEKTPALRALALELAEEPRYATLLAGALTVVERPTRVDPITTTIVLACIVLVLQTRFEVTYDNQHGKKKLHVGVSKAPTSEKLLAKLFGLTNAARRP